jgi:hypothetical protein
MNELISSGGGVGAGFVFLTAAIVAAVYRYRQARRARDALVKNTLPMHSADIAHTVDAAKSIFAAM